MKATYKDGNIGTTCACTDNNGAEEISLLTIWLIRSKVNKVLEDGRDSLTEIMKLDTCLNGILYEQNKRKKTTVELNSNIGSTSSLPTQQHNAQQNFVSDPTIPVKTKGRPRVATRIKSGIEVAKETKKQRTCSYCGGKGHYITGCQQKKVSLRWSVYIQSCIFSLFLTMNLTYLIPDG